MVEITPKRGPARFRKQHIEEEVAAHLPEIAGQLQVLKQMIAQKELETLQDAVERLSAVTDCRRPSSQLRECLSRLRLGVRLLIYRCTLKLSAFDWHLPLLNRGGDHFVVEEVPCMIRNLLSKSLEVVCLY